MVDAAARLMYDHGIAATSVDDVLAASGTGKSQMYHYFGGKQALTVAVFEYQLGRVLAAQPSLHDPDCVDLYRWRDEVLVAQRESACGNCPLGVFNGQVDDPALRTSLADAFDRWRQAITGLVTRAMAAGQVSDVDPDAAGLTLLAALQGGTMMSHLRGDSTPLVGALTAAIDGMTRGRP
jgi:AcrR family transcriptional regulator